MLLALSFVLPGPFAFTIAFSFGLVYSVILTGRWVFSSVLTRERLLLCCIAYAVIYLCGTGSIALLGLLNSPLWANGASVLLTAPLSYVAGRVTFNGSSSRQEIE